MNKQEFVRRRKQLMQVMAPGSVAILPAAPMRIRNRDVEYHYRQDSDFYYLTGFSEHDAVTVIIPGREHGEYILFCREHDPEKALWNGPHAGQEGAVEAYGADDSFPIDDIDDILPGMLEGKDRVYYTMGNHPDFDQRLIGWVNRLRKQARAGVHTPGEFVALDHLLHEMRLFKSPTEQRIMRKAARISARAHCRAMKKCKPGLREYQVESELLYSFMQQGARFTAYSSIVGGGANGCILHYIDNQDVLQDGKLLLIDAGAELDHYASDITRTFPVNGRFSPAQRALYEIVLEAQYAAIEQVRPGNHWNDPHDAAVRVITTGLKSLGLLKGSVNKLIKDEAYKPFYM
ncbi:MAG: aminopeptidase P N-terminal domain-containing protein, partial [Gammaproteobacteria bacterium]